MAVGAIGWDDRGVVGPFGPALALARADARRRWRTWIVAVLVVGGLGGGLFAVLAGARRTASAYERLSAASAAPDVVVAPASECTDSMAVCQARSASALQQLETHEAVRGVAYVTVLSGVFTLGDGRVYQEECDTGSGEAGVLTPTSKPAGEAVERPVLLEGRAADPTKVDEVVVGIAAHASGARVGDTLVADLGEFCPDDESPPRVRVDLHVVGVVADTIGLRPELGQFLRTIYGTSALDAWARARHHPGFPAALVRLAPGATAETLLDIDPPLFAQLDGQSQRAAIERSVDPDTLVLLLMAGLGAALGLMVIAPALMRAERDLVRDAPTLRSIGWTRRDLAFLGLVHGVAVAVPAVVVAMAVAVALSPTMPVGDAAAFEPTPGVSVDWVVLGPGAVVLLLATVGLATLTARARHGAAVVDGPRATGTRVADRLRVPPVGRLGARFACDAVAGRVASGAGRVITVVIAIVGVVGALTFSAGLADLKRSPRLVGWNWDAMAVAGAHTSDLAAALRESPGVERVSVGTYFTPGSEGFSIGASSEPSWLMSLEDGPSAVPFTIIDGRSPSGDREVMVHPRLLDTLGLQIGDRTTVQLAPELGGTVMEVTVVGSGVLPVDAQQFEEAVGMTYDGLSELFGALGAEPVEPEVVVVDFAPSADVGAINARLMADGLIDEDLISADGAALGSRLVAGLTVEGVDDVPRVLAALAAVLAVGVLLHLLAARRREWRRELALHRAIGFTRGGVRAAVGLGGGLVGLLAVVIGVPIGVMVGRRSWLLYADDLGVKPEATVPWAWLAVVAVGAIGVAAACAAIAGALDRKPLAEVLRAE
jgi:hypothetical protein